MKREIRQLVGLITAAGSLLLLLGCDISEGSDFKVPEGQSASEFYGYAICEKTAECGVGRYCDDETNLCSTDCTNSRDCYFKDVAAQQAWETARDQGISFEDAELPDPKYKCSACGTCIPVEDRDDPRCFVVQELICSEDSDCENELGEGYGCDPQGLCTLTCAKDSDCDALGEGHQCTDKGGKMLCEKWCIDDSSCALHGFDWECRLPDEIDQLENFWSHDPEIGSCAPRFGGVDWGEQTDETLGSAKYTGVYGTMMSLAFTNCGFPVGKQCQDSTNVHHILFRIRQTETGIELDGKFCSHLMLNFMPDDDDPTHDKIFDDIAWMEAPRRYTLHIPYHHWNMEIGGVSLSQDPIPTDMYMEVRGTLLDDMANDPMPTSDDLTNAWDQDRDGNPGVTSMMNGVIQGWIYNVNRAFMDGTFQPAELDKEGKVRKIWGHIGSINESHVIGASDPMLMVDTTGYLYENIDRSYMRFQRMADDATCDDLLNHVGLEGRIETACAGNVNERYIDPSKDDNWLCYTPTIDGPNPPAEAEE